MKKPKRFLLLVGLTLLLSTLACRLPFIGRAVEGLGDAAGDVFNEVVGSTEGETAPPEPAETELAMAETNIYSDNGVQMTLPGSYVLGDVENDLATLVQGLQAMNGETADNLQQLYNNNKEDILFWAYDTNSPSGHMTSILVLKNEEFAGIPLTLIAAASNLLLGENVDSMTQSQMTLGDRDVLRFQTTSENAGVPTAQAVYLFNEGGKLWLVGFFTTQEQFDARLFSFDAAVESFSYTPEE